MTPDDVNMVTNFISTVGFPIFVAVFMLVKGSKDSGAIKDALNDLTTAIKLLQESNDKSK